MTKLTSKDIRRTFDVNLFAHFWMNKQILPKMIQRRSGQIVAISSIAGLTGTANLVDYWFVQFYYIHIFFYINSNIHFLKLKVHQNLLSPE